MLRLPDGARDQLHAHMTRLPFIADALPPPPKDGTSARAKGSDFGGAMQPALSPHAVQARQEAFRRHAAEVGPFPPIAARAP